jgi:hypothetical protein
MFGKYRIIIIVVIILGIGFLIFATTRKPAPADDLLTANPVDSAQPRTEILGAEIINALNQIESLRLSREIFNDPVFLSLTDQTQVLTAEPVGKRNPFDPISTSRTQTQAPTTTTQTQTSTSTPRNSIIRPPAQPVI